MTSGPSTNAVSTPTVARAGSSRSPRLIQKSRGDGSYSQLRRISSPLTAKKISTPTLPSVLPSWCSGSGWSEHREGVRHQDRPGGEQPEQVEVVVPTADDLGEAHGREGPRGGLREGRARGGHGRQVTNATGPGAGSGERGAERPRITHHGLPRPDDRGTRTPAATRRTVVVLGAAVVSGIAGYLVLVLTARFLDARRERRLPGVLGGPVRRVRGPHRHRQETTRAVFAAERAESARRAASGWSRSRRPSVPPPSWCWASRVCGGEPTCSATAGPTCCPCCWSGSCCSRCTAGSPAPSPGRSEWDRYAGAGGRRVHRARARRGAGGRASAPPSSGSR